MKRLLRGCALLTIAVAAIGADCCDARRHALMQENEKSVDLCRERGGIPILETLTTESCDDGGHCFKTLKRCDFPGQLRLQGEK